MSPVSFTYVGLLHFFVFFPLAVSIIAVSYRQACFRMIPGGWFGNVGTDEMPYAGDSPLYALHLLYQYLAPEALQKLCSLCLINRAHLPARLSIEKPSVKVGRKFLLSASMVLAALAATLFALGSGSGAGVVVTAACLFNAFSTCGWNSLGVISTEAFPTSARVSGMAVVAAAGRLGSIAAQFVNGSLEDNVLVLLMVTSGLTLVGGVASLLLPRDTLGVPLDDTPSHRAVG